MDDLSGRLVISVAGRDKGLTLCVVRTEGDYVFLCDGKLRKLESPKKKKYKHVKPIVDAPDELLAKVDTHKLTNRMLRQLINRYLLSQDSLTVHD